MANTTLLEISRRGTYFDKINKGNIANKIIIMGTMVYYKVSKKAKDQELIQSSTTPDPGHHIHKKTSCTREQRGKPFFSR